MRKILNNKASFPREVSTLSIETCRYESTKCYQEIACRGRIPAQNKADIPGDILRMNRYLEHMGKSIRRAGYNKEYKKAAKLGGLLLENSHSFTLICMHKSNKDGYGRYSKKEIAQFYFQIRKFLRKKGQALDVRRVYIPKKNGKFRPLGVPSFVSKTVSHMITQVLKHILEHQISENQYGFLTKRSTTQASGQIYLGYLNGKRGAYEFDLKSFFNTVNVQFTCSKMNSFIRGLGDGLLELSHNTIAKFKTLKMEKELTEVYYKGKRLVRKSGFPQGLPFSPLLSIGALNGTGFHEVEGLIQFADDGVILSREQREINIFNRKTDLIGIKLADDKPHGGTQKFKYLGITGNLKDGFIEGKDHKIELTEENSEQIEEICRYAKYEDPPEPKDRKYHDESILMYHMGLDRMVNPNSLLEDLTSITNEKGKMGYNYESARAFRYLQTFLKGNSTHKIVKGNRYQATDKAKSGYEVKFQNNCLIYRSPTGGHLGEDYKYLEESIKNNIKTFNYFK